MTDSSAFKSKYPEHEKLLKWQYECQILGEFTEWMSKEYDLNIQDVNDTIYKFFGVDKDKLEEERRRMLNEN